MTNLEKTNQFLTKVKEKFPQFDYSKVEIFSNQEKDKITIICSEHGEFTTTPRTFLKSKYGCPKCANILKGLNSRKNENEIGTKIVLPGLDPILNPLIVSKEKLIGTVYCFINRINNKIYIGETVKSDYNERFYEHKNKAIRGENMYFYKAIRKYGWDSFDKIILYQTEVLTNTDENKKVLNDLVNDKEAYYINHFDTTNHKKGYNITSGGDGIVGYKHSEETKKLFSEQRSGNKHWKYGTKNIGGDVILQFDLDFNLLNKFPSMSEAARELNCNANNISCCCNNKIDTYKGFIWVKEKDYYEGYLQKYKSRAKCTSNDKAVLQYDFSGNFINEYISCSQAGKALGRKTVSTAANGRDAQLYGYIWIYKKDFTEELLEEKLIKAKDTAKYRTFIKKLNE